MTFLIFRRFPNTFRKFPKILQNNSEGQTNVSEHFLEFSEDFREKSDDVSTINWFRTLFAIPFKFLCLFVCLFVFLNKDWSWRRGGDVSISQKKSEDDQHETADFWWDLYKESAKTKRLTEILLLSDLAFEMQRGWRRPCLYTDLVYLTSLHLYMYMRKSYACIKARSPPTSLAIIGQVTETHNWQYVHRYRDTSTG